MSGKLTLVVPSSQVVADLPPVDANAPLEEWSRPQAYRELLAQMYLDIWVRNPGITRADALPLMRKAGVHLIDTNAITRITTSPEFKTLQQGILSQSRARMMDYFDRNLGTVIQHQMKIASGEQIEDADGKLVNVNTRDQTTAGRTIIDAFIRFGDSFDDQHSDGAERKVVFNVNTYFSPTVDGEEDESIIEGQVELIEDDVKDRFTMQEQPDKEED